MWQAVPCPVGKHGVIMSFLGAPVSVCANTQADAVWRCMHFDLLNASSVAETLDVHTDFSKPVPVTGICNNQFSNPCGAQKILYPVCKCSACLHARLCDAPSDAPLSLTKHLGIVSQGEPLGYIKLQIIQQQTPISRVEVYLGSSWTRLYRSGDGFFEPGHDLPLGPVVGLDLWPWIFGVFVQTWKALCAFCKALALPTGG
jgi:hypothetical protein